MRHWQCRLCYAFAQTSAARFCGQCGAPLQGPLFLLPQRNAAMLQMEEFMVRRVNEERQSAGLHSLTAHPRLASVARAHSAEMKLLNYFEHESPTPQLRTITDRFVLAFGERPPFLAENIAYSKRGGENHLTNEHIERAHQGLMNSPGHRANILEPTPSHTGIGIFHENGELWITQMFWSPDFA